MSDSALAEHVFADVDAPSPRGGTEESRWQPAEDPDDSGRPMSEPARVAILYPLTRLGDRVLTVPLVVVVESEDDSVIMSSPKLRIWGTGADVYEALDDFAVTYFDVLNSYVETAEDELTPGALDYRNQLQSYLRKTE